MTHAAYIASTLLVLAVLFCSVASEQEMEPRAYSRAPRQATLGFVVPYIKGSASGTVLKINWR